MMDKLPIDQLFRLGPDGPEGISDTALVRALDHEEVTNRNGDHVRRHADIEHEALSQIAPLRTV